MVKRIIIYCAENQDLLSKVKIILNTFLISFGIRVDTELYLKQGLTYIKFVGSKLRGLNPDISSALGLLKAIINKKSKISGVTFVEKTPSLFNCINFILSIKEGYTYIDFNELTLNKLKSTSCVSLVILCNDAEIPIKEVKYSYVKFISPKYFKCLDQAVTVFHYVLDNLIGGYVRRAGSKSVTFVPPM